MNPLNSTFNRKKGGYTFVETMIAVGVSTMVIASTISIFVMIERVAFESGRINKINNEARMFSDFVSRDLRMANRLADRYDIYSVTEGSLIMKVPSIDANEYILDVLSATDEIILHTFDYIVYFRDERDNPDVVIREVFPNPASARTRQSTLFGNYVSGNSYTGTFDVLPNALGAFVVYYQFMDTHHFQDNVYEMPISGSIRLRNKQ